MNKRLYGWALALVLGGLHATPAFATIRVTLYDTPYNDTSGGGGEFAAVSDFDFLQFYNSKATYDPTGPVGMGFGTFCLEYSEHINYGVSYYAVINYGAVSGGQNVNNMSPSANGMDRISKGTAWLYSQYAAGTLAGYNYGTTGESLNNRRQSSRLLQLAIWYLEGEIALSYSERNSNPFLSLANTKYGSYLAAAANADIVTYGSVQGVEYGVVALNLYTGYDPATGKYSGKAQDQLAIIPEPGTMIAGTLLLLPFGLRIARRLRGNKTNTI